MNFKLRAFVLTVVIFGGCFSSYLFADTITFTLGNHPQPGEENVLFLSDQGPAMLIMGFTNQSNTEVDFSSTTDLLIGKGGQAKITAEDGLINDITITLPGHPFTDLIFNPFKACE